MTTLIEISNGANPQFTGIYPGNALLVFTIGASDGFVEYPILQFNTVPESGMSWERQRVFNNAVEIPIG